MTKEFQFRRGTSAEHAAFKGASGEITVDTNKFVAVVHDNQNFGGFELVGIAATQTVRSKTIIAGSATSTGTSSQPLQVVGGAYVSGNLGIGSTNPSSTLSVVGDFAISGAISFGGTVAQFNSTNVQFTDQDLTLNAGPSIISSDTNADSSGIAVASTEGSPLVNLNITSYETSPSTYKKFMWFKNNASGLGTDAWLANYAVGIGSTQFPTGTRLAAGSVQFTANDLSAVRNINASGIITSTQMDLTANAVVNDSVLYLSGTPYGTGAGSKNGLLGIGQLGFNDTNIIANFTHNVNSYAQVILQNTNSGTNASSDFIVNNDRVGGTTYYGDFGINATGFTSTSSPFSDPDGTYLYASGGTLAVGTNDAKDFRIATGSAAATPVTRMTILGTSGLIGIGTTNPSTPLDVAGEIKTRRTDSTNEGGQITFTRAIDDANAYAIDVYGNTAGNVRLRCIDYAAGSERISLDGAGNLLIGTASSTGTATQALQVNSGAYIANSVGLGSTSPTARLNIAGGTATANTSPLKFNRGTVLSGIETGAVEYDGRSLNFTPDTSFGRASIPTTVYTSGAGTNLTIGGESTVQTLFPAANDTITLQVGTYFLTVDIAVTRGTTSTTSAALRIRFGGGGTAGGTFSGHAIGSGADAGAATAHRLSSVTLTTDNIISNTSTTASSVYVSKVSGILRITTAGTFIPQYSLSAIITAGSATAPSASNYMIIQSLDTTGSAASIGGWA